MNVLVGMTPSWFRGVDAALELFSFIIALLIAHASYKAYQVSNQRRYLAFAGAFILLGLSFLARMFTEALVYLEVLRDFQAAVAEGVPVEPSFLIGRFIYIVVVFVAYLLMVAVALRLEDKRTLTLLFALLAVLGWQAHTHPTTTAFHLVNLILLLFITQHFTKNYLDRGSKNSFLIMLAFIFLLGETLLFLASNFLPLLYIGAYLFRFAGYFLLLTGFIRVIRA